MRETTKRLNDRVKGVTMENMQTNERDEAFMRSALKEGMKALDSADVPIGAVVVCDGAIIARAYNRREKDKDPTAHAEVLALRKAAKRKGVWNLSDCTLYVTLEPCAMCSGAIVYSRVARVVYGAHDLRFGCSGSVMNLLDGSKLNHSCPVTGGVLEDECLAPIREFFKNLRKK